MEWGQGGPAKLAPTRVATSTVALPTSNPRTIGVVLCSVQSCGPQGSPLSIHSHTDAHMLIPQVVHTAEHATPIYSGTQAFLDSWSLQCTTQGARSKPPTLSIAIPFCVVDTQAANIQGGPIPKQETLFRSTSTQCEPTNQHHVLNALVSKALGHFHRRPSLITPHYVDSFVPLEIQHETTSRGATVQTLNVNL